MVRSWHERQVSHLLYRQNNCSIAIDNVSIIDDFHIKYGKMTLFLMDTSKAFYDVIKLPKLKILACDVLWSCVVSEMSVRLYILFVSITSDNVCFDFPCLNHSLDRYQYLSWYLRSQFLAELFLSPWLWCYTSYVFVW